MCTLSELECATLCLWRPGPRPLYRVSVRCDVLNPLQSGVRWPVVHQPIKPFPRLSFQTFKGEVHVDSESTGLLLPR